MTESLPILKIDPRNIVSLSQCGPPIRLSELLIDINDTCNARCVYCPNPRTKARIELQQFSEFLNNRIEFVEQVQWGCGQEPTADKRLDSFMEIVHQSHVKPSRIQMITNATLMHRFDYEKWADLGLSALCVSIDTIDPEISSLTRVGIDLELLKNNLQVFRLPARW